MGKVGTYPIDARILEKYEILELLGTGGFSEVVKAKNKETGSVCAIKIIANPKDDPNYISEMESIENEINILKVHSLQVRLVCGICLLSQCRIINQASMLYSHVSSYLALLPLLQLLSHPRIVKLYDCYRMDDYIYVCMELYVTSSLPKPAWSNSIFVTTSREEH